MEEVQRSPSQAIFDQLYIYSNEMGYKTYDYLPLESASLPFVYIGQITEQDRSTKMFLYGDVQLSLHVYGGYRQRRQVTDMVNNLKFKILNLKKIGDMNVNVKRTTGQTLIDDTTPTTLLHGILEIEFSFN